MYLTRSFSHSILECNSLLIAISLLTVDIISQKPPFFNILRLILTFLPVKINKSKKISRLNRLIYCEMIFTFVFLQTHLYQQVQVVRRKCIMERVTKFEP